MLYHGVNYVGQRNLKHLWSGVCMNREKMIKKIEECDFYIINEPAWTEKDLKDTLKKLKEEGRMV